MCERLSRRDRPVRSPVGRAAAPLAAAGVRLAYRIRASKAEDHDLPARWGGRLREGRGAARGRPGRRDWGSARGGTRQAEAIAAGLVAVDHTVAARRAALAARLLRRPLDAPVCRIATAATCLGSARTGAPAVVCELGDLQRPSGCGEARGDPVVGRAHVRGATEPRARSQQPCKPHRPLPCWVLALTVRP